MPTHVEYYQVLYSTCLMTTVISIMWSVSRVLEAEAANTELCEVNRQRELRRCFMTR